MPKSRVRPNKKKPKAEEMSSLMSIQKSLKSIDRWQQVEARGSLPLVPDDEPIKLSVDKVHSVWKNVDKGSIIASTTIAQTTVYTFSLGDVSDNTSYANVFDQFRIHQVQLIIVPDTIGSNTTNVLPLSSVIDYDDASPLTSLSALYEYDNVLTTQVGQMHIRTFSPATAIPVYTGSAFSGYTQGPKSLWLDTASTSGVYYGVKIYWLASPASAQYSVTARYLLQFRKTR